MCAALGHGLAGRAGLTSVAALILHPRHRAFTGRPLLRAGLTAHRLTRNRCGLRTALRTGRALHRLARRTGLTGRLILHPRNRALTGPALRAGLAAHRLTGKCRRLRSGSLTRRA